jgi:hypothetical protein
MHRAPSSSEIGRHQLAVAPIPSASRCDDTCRHIALVGSNFKEARCAVGSVVCEIRSPQWYVEGTIT